MSVQQASQQLAELLRNLGPGDEIVLTQDNKPVARIVSDTPRPAARQPGNCKGMLTINSEDDQHLDGFKDYMP
jgi:antitoxin (DNA-binding transcriptional repressor) of toxin-antitoxin stability system